MLQRHFIKSVVDANRQYESKSTDESGLVCIVAGTEQVILQMTAEGGDRRGVPNGSG